MPVLPRIPHRPRLRPTKEGQLTSYYRATAHYHIIKRQTKNRVYSVCGISNYIQVQEVEGGYPAITHFTTHPPAKTLCPICAGSERKITPKQEANHE